MDIDQIRVLAGDYAAKLNMGEPKVKAARFSSLAPTGLRPRLSRRRPVLIVDSRFDELESAEQEAAIAGALVSAANSRRYWRNMTLACFFLLVAGFIIGGMAAYLPGWAGHMLLLAPPACCLLTIPRLHRRFMYAMDRATVEAFGWAVIDVSLELQRKTAFKTLDPQRLFMPNMEQRRARLDRLRASQGLQISAGPV